MTDLAWRATFWQSLILGISTSLLTVAMRNSLPTVSTVFLIVAAFNLSILILLLFKRKHRNETLASVLYFLNILFSALAVGINQQVWLLSSKPVELFFGHKIIALMVAFQAPPRKWVGFLSLLSVLIVPVSLMMLWTPEQRDHLSAQEPWFTLTLILSCFFVYFQRVKTFELIHEKVKLETSVREWKKFAQFLLGLQHLVNSPLQIIDTAAELLEKRHPETHPIPTKIQAALVPLRRIAQMLSKGQTGMKWEGIQMSLSIEDLEKEMQGIAQLERDMMEK